MPGPGEQRFDLTASKALALEAAREWGLELGEPFAFSYVSYVAPARDLLAELDPGAQWLVHGDFHHYNILRRGDEFVAIDPKPYLADREYDVPSFLWNPRGNQMEDRQRTERRIAAFVAAGLDDFRIRAWTVIRGAYLRPDFSGPIRALIEAH